MKTLKIMLGQVPFFLCLKIIVKANDMMIVMVKNKKNGTSIVAVIIS